MALLSRCLKTLGVLIGTLLIGVVMTAWSQRISLWYVAIPASLTLAVAYWTRARAWPLVAVLFALALVCVVVPADLEFDRTAGPGFHRTESSGIQVLPVTYGIACFPGKACRGCREPRNAPRYAVV